VLAPGLSQIDLGTYRRKILKRLSDFRFSLDLFENRSVVAVHQFVVKPLTDHPLPRPAVSMQHDTKRHAALFVWRKRQSLLTLSSPAQPVGYFFVNFPSVADGENPDLSSFAIHLINDTKASDFDSPQSGQLTDQWRSGKRIRAQRSKCLLNGAL
jgi:hypothetical protein